MEVSKLIEVINSDYEKIYAFAFRMIGNHEDTKDTLQNSFIKAYTNIEKFRGNASITTWFYRIVINESYRYFETLKKLPLQLITENLNISETHFFESIEYERKIDDELIIEELRERCLFAFLKCMQKNQRVCFLLKTCLELSIKEIAEVMNLSVENVKVTLHRGRKRLQDLFNNRCSLIDPENPCKCYLWIKYMKDNNRKLPQGYNQIKNDRLKQQHFINMSALKKIDYLYSVEQSISKPEFINQLQLLSRSL